jgi:hypothetical protein
MRSGVGRATLFIMLAALAAVAGIFYLSVRNVQAAPVTLQSGITAPANGTANELNLSFNAQDWIGFYGNLTMNITQFGTSNALFRNYVRNGTVYVTSHSENPNFATLIVSPPDLFADQNLTLNNTAYTTSLMGFGANPALYSLCGIYQGLFYVNTTDNIPIGIEKDGNASGFQHYLFCSPVIQIASGSSALGTSYDFAVIAPATPTYGGALGYDLYYEGGIVNTT